jgi:hypothetical protein
MARGEEDYCEFRGWVLIDLDDPIPKRAYVAANRLGIKIENFIDLALEEKLDRMKDAETA